MPVMAAALYGLLPGSLVERTMVAGLACIIFVPVHVLTFERSYRRRLRKALVKAMGTDQPIPTEYEIDEAGLVFRKQGQEVRFSWGNVRELRDTGEWLELVMEPKGVALIPKRAFGSPGEQWQWVSHLEEHTGLTLARD
jgi:hypothetical protein